MQECKELTLIEFLDPSNSFAFACYNSENDLISLNRVELLKIDGAFNEELTIRIKLNDIAEDKYVERMLLIEAAYDPANKGRKIDMHKEKISFCPNYEQGSLFYYYILTVLKIILKVEADEISSFKFVKIQA